MGVLKTSIADLPPLTHHSAHLHPQHCPPDPPSLAACSLAHPPSNSARDSASGLPHSRVMMVVMSSLASTTRTNHLGGGGWRGGGGQVGGWIGRHVCGGGAHSCCTRDELHWSPSAAPLAQTAALAPPQHRSALLASPLAPGVKLQASACVWGGRVGGWVCGWVGVVSNLAKSGHTCCQGEGRCASACAQPL